MMPNTITATLNGGGGNKCVRYSSPYSRSCSQHLSTEVQPCS